MEQFDSLNIDERAFRSREYIFVFEDSNDRHPIAFGRGRVHRDTKDWGEITSIHIEDYAPTEEVFRLLIDGIVDNFEKEELDADATVYAFTDDTSLYQQFGFSPIEEDDLPLHASERLETKQNDLNKDLTPLKTTLEQIVVPEGQEEIVTAEEIQHEKEAMGFSDDEEQTYKYST